MFDPSLHGWRWQCWELANGRGEVEGCQQPGISLSIHHKRLNWIGSHLGLDLGRFPRWNLGVWNFIACRCFILGSLQTTSGALTDKKFSTFAQFRAVVMWAYDMDLITFYEFYSMNMPIFMPSHLSKYLFQQEMMKSCIVHRTLSWVTINGVTIFMEMIVHLVVRSFIVMLVNLVRESTRERERERERQRNTTNVNSQTRFSNQYSVPDRFFLTQKEDHGAYDYQWKKRRLDFGASQLWPPDIDASWQKQRREVKRGMPRKTPTKHIQTLIWCRTCWGISFSGEEPGCCAKNSPLHGLLSVSPCALLRFHSRFAGEDFRGKGWTRFLPKIKVFIQPQKVGWK